MSGMAIGTLFTLFIVPSIYMAVARTRTADVRADDAAQDRVGALVDTPRQPGWSAT